MTTIRVKTETGIYRVNFYNINIEEELKGLKEVKWNEDEGLWEMTDAMLDWWIEYDELLDEIDATAEAVVSFTGEEKQDVLDRHNSCSMDMEQWAKQTLFSLKLSLEELENEE